MTRQQLGMWLADQPDRTWRQADRGLTHVEKGYDYRYEVSLVNERNTVVAVGRGSSPDIALSFIPALVNIEAKHASR